MTLLADLAEAPPLPLSEPVSAAGLTPWAWVRRHRGLLLLGAALVLVLLLLVLTSGVGRSGSLDPDSYEPAGGRALATLLRDQGVDVQRTGDIPTTTRNLPHDATIFVSDPSLLSPEELSDLQGAGVRLVLVADPATVVLLGVQVRLDGVVSEGRRDPGCGYGPAVASRTVRTGGDRFTAVDPHAQLCYDRTLVHLPDQDLVLLGSGKALTNQRLGDDGNAELGLQLLGQGKTVRWLVPDPNRTAVGGRHAKSFGELLPGWVAPAERWLLVVAVLVIAWRGRRLGRVVPEPLPVVVRAAETVEGRGRLYRAAGARGSAAEALRSGASHRIGGRLGAGRHPTPESLVDLVSRRTSRPAAEVHTLLYGPPPVDDAALVRLARDLDALALEVSGS
ncbi:MAG: hypothetical protein QOG99_3761 [Frankiales bacterium]|nr:hypothetical protein [Frankiales bacterium]